LRAISMLKVKQDSHDLISKFELKVVMATPLVTIIARAPHFIEISTIRYSKVDIFGVHGAHDIGILQAIANCI
jgi:hypothetical protein